MKLIFIVLRILLGIFAVQARQKTRIRYGHPINDIKTMPWNVFIIFYTKTTENICSGSIVGTQIILTAAHCLHPGKMTKITAFASTLQKYSSGAIRYPIDKFSIHPRYQTDTGYNLLYDIAFLKTHRKIRFDEWVQKIGLQFQPIENDMIAMKMGYSNDDKGRLRYAFTTVRKCDYTPGSEIICATTRDSVLTKRDLGGPLIVCRDEMAASIRCGQVGVAVGNRQNDDLYVSVLIEREYIRKSLSGKDFKYISTGPISDGAL